MNILTLQQLKDMKPRSVFALGDIIDSPEGANVAGTGKTMKWVAVRGIIHDWTIYTDNPYSPQESYEAIARMGDKIHNKEIIQKLVPCDEEALKMYRN